MEWREAAVRTAISNLDMRVARSLDEALTIMRDEKRTPIAGATDVYVALNFGTFTPKQYLDIWALDDLRTIHHAASASKLDVATVTKQSADC